MSTAEMDKGFRSAELTHGLHETTCDATVSDFVADPRKWWIAAGIFLFVLGIYALTSPGRIDTVDAQARFDVSYNWIVNGKPIITDRWISGFMGTPGKDGLLYSYYGAPASIFAVPLVWLGLHTSAPAIQLSQFLFSLTSPIFGAGIALILFLFYLELEITPRKAFCWTMVSSFATYLWPISNSAFDNGQHAFFSLLSLYLGFLSAKRRSTVLAVLGGFMAGVLFLYQEYFFLIAPALAVSTLAGSCFASSLEVKTSTDRVLSVAKLTSRGKGALQPIYALLREAWKEPGAARSSCMRYLAFLAGVSLGVGLAFAYNDFRFGSWLDDGKVRALGANDYPLFGNPLAGFLTLLVSPGKSVFLYSPPIVLAVLGMRHLWRERREIALAVLVATLALVSFLSCISFAGGDWCWGPRYLTPLAGLWALALPFARIGKNRRELVVAVVGASFIVQVLALSVENQRFFFELAVEDHFWAQDSWFYFKHSALLARFGEAASLSQGVPATAHWFNSLPVPGWTTYTLLGPPPNIPRKLSPTWIRNFKLYFLPRPWPLWMSWVPKPERPINMRAWLIGLMGTMTAGAWLTCRGLRGAESQ